MTKSGIDYDLLKSRGLVEQFESIEAHLEKAFVDEGYDIFTHPTGTVRALDRADARLNVDLSGVAYALVLAGLRLTDTPAHPVGASA